jgi:pullulanase/glycogen debranching enzyme
MTEEAWRTGWVKSFGVRWAGDMIPGIDERGRPNRGDTLLLLFNAHHKSQPFQIPSLKPGQAWELLFDTTEPHEFGSQFENEFVYPLHERSMAVLRTVKTGLRAKLRK